MLYSLPYDFLIDGDNVLVFADHADAGPMVVEHVKKFGHELKHEVFNTLNEIEFCQGKIVYVDGVPTMIRDPYKVMATTFVNHRHYHEERGGRRYSATVAQALMVINRGVPIIQAFAEVERRNVKLLPGALDWQLKIVEEISRSWTKFEPKPVTMSTRLSFEEAFGLSPVEQVEIERSLAPKIGLVSEPCPLLVSSAGGLYDLSDPAA